MPNFGVLPEGFRRKRYTDIIDAERARAMTNFGDDVNLDTDKPLGKFLDIVAWALSELWECGENTYNCISIDTASGIHLDTLVKYRGIRRYDEITATGAVIVSGETDVNVPIGFIVAKANGIQYYTSNSYVIGDDGTVKVGVTCNTSGNKGNADVDEINEIATPVTGITSVTNITPFINGRDTETDEQLRNRYYSTVGGLSTVRSIENAIANVEGVLDIRVIENPSTQTDDNGVPPKSFAPYVYAYETLDGEIAEAILTSKPAGIQSYGGTYVETLDENGFTHNIGFTYAQAHEVDVQISIKVNQFFPLQSDGANTIKDKIVEYIGGEMTDGTLTAGLGMGGTVNRSYIYSLVWSVEGIADVGVQIKNVADSDYSGGLTEITAAVTETPRANADNIEVIFV